MTTNERDTMKNKVKIAVVLLLAPTLLHAYPKGSHKSDYAGVYSSPSTCYACTHRSSSARNEFIRDNPRPYGGKYIVDHVIPLKRGGADAPYNMQWQSEAAALAKDKWEWPTPKSTVSASLKPAPFAVRPEPPWRELRRPVGIAGRG